MYLKVGGFAFLLVLFACTYHCHAKDYFPVKFGTCPRPEIKGELDVEKFFTGRWYVQKSMGQYLFQLGGTCATTLANVTRDGKHIKMVHYQYEPLLKTYVKIWGTAQTKFTKFKGIYSPVEYDAIGVGFSQFEVPFVVVDTDYDNWAVVFFCKQYPTGFKSELGWMMSRRRNDRSFIPNMEVAQRLVENERFEDEDNSNCGLGEPKLY